MYNNGLCIYVHVQDPSLFIITKDRVKMALNLFCTAKGDVSYKDKGTSPQTAVLKNWWKKDTSINKEQSRTDLL